MTTTKDGFNVLKHIYFSLAKGRIRLGLLIKPRDTDTCYVISTLNIFETDSNALSGLRLNWGHLNY